MEWDVATCSVARTVIAHTKCVTSVCPVVGGGVTTSGKDGFVKVFDVELMNKNRWEIVMSL